jgi:hypothetical protein
MTKRMDITGQKFGMLTAVSFVYTDRWQQSVWLFRCDCGNTKEIKAGKVRAGKTKSCGCLKHQNITGQKFAMLTAISCDDERSSRIKTHTFWWFRCDCGKIRSIAKSCVMLGRTKSCGCLHRITNQNRSINWQGKVFTNYRNGANQRGLVFSLSREQFSEIIEKDCFYCGTHPDKTIGYYGQSYAYNGVDRVDNSRGYEPGNVVPCCSMCNLMKKAYSAEQFIEHAKKIAAHQIAT